ncbi:MAG: NAD-glutamate dehydrogenase [bacterium]|nr:NAD-glutamate dehydrogenase [bacterium]
MTFGKHTVKNAAIDSILNQFPVKEKGLIQFGRMLLSTMSDRTLTHISTPDLGPLIKEQFAFVSSSIKQKKHGFRIYPSKGRTSWLQNRVILEVIHPDAPHQLLTVENVLEEEGVRITRKLHPILGIKRNKDDYDITQPHDCEERVSYLFLAFEYTGDDAQIKRIESRIDFHLQNIRCASDDSEPIISQLDMVKALIENTTTKSSEPKSEWVDLVDWLKNLNFSFFGYMPISIEDKKSATQLSNGLGILSNKNKFNSELIDTLLNHTQIHNSKNESFRFDTIPYTSPIQRFEQLMRLAVRIPDSNGKTSTIHTFVGILKRSSLHAKNSTTPLIHLKMEYVIQTKNLLPGSYDYNEVIRIFTSIPKFELFRTPREQLLEMVDNLLSVTNPNHIQCFPNGKDAAGYTFILIVVPEFLFNQDNIGRIERYFQKYIPYIDAQLVPIQANEKCRIHLYLKLKKGVRIPDPNVLEATIGEVIRPWEDQVRQYLIAEYQNDEMLHLNKKYLDKIPNHYKERTHPQDAIVDLQNLERLSDTHPVHFEVGVFAYPSESELANKASLIHVYSKAKIDLITIMPVLQNLGLHVIDQLTSRFGNAEQNLGFVQSFRVTDKAKNRIDGQRTDALIEEILTTEFNGQTDDNPLNALVLSAELNWKELIILKCYRNYLCQISSSTSKHRVNTTLINHPHIAAQLVRYFDSRFNPNAKLKPKTELAKFNDLLKHVNDLTEDRLLRQLENSITATLRVNYYQDKTDTALAIKVDSRLVAEMPTPKPYREIYVYDHQFEGIHLRFGAVARGGLRWSDRMDDFRTEILGLVKTQQTKNVVIVPVGSKGGFVVKNPPEDRNEAFEYGKFQYQRFIRNLLSLTDNRSSKGRALPPKKTVCFDEPDPYLVVAADKGTATFSDLANSVSEAEKFWLGDAFASGGSYGYDHKKVGITARGAWECALLHFKANNLDIATQPVSAAGVGDMSGDVFGNGMLLSQNIALKAAFNHMHIFIDPNPEVKSAWKERKRLFDLPRSQWTDYNTTLLSKGGFIANRNDKEITLSKEAKAFLDTKLDTISGEALIRLILISHVDFLWFGGIGTYIKSSTESHLEAGDPSNNNVRINANECKAKIIAEGANLATTQKARIEFSLKNGHINTDAIDNSAGVNMSDYEVNLKIFLKHLMDTGKVKSLKNRNSILEQATEEVSELVLKNNRDQHHLISMDNERSKTSSTPFSDFITAFVEKGRLDTASESIPSLSKLETMAKKNGIPRPILAVLQAYAKMQVFDEIVNTPLVLKPEFDDLYMSYYPESILKTFKADVFSHPLKAEITAMLLTNHVINHTGLTAIDALAKQTKRSIADSIDAYMAVEKEEKAEKKRAQCKTISDHVALENHILEQTKIKLELK